MEPRMTADCPVDILPVAAMLTVFIARLKVSLSSEVNVGGGGTSLTSALETDGEFVRRSLRSNRRTDR